MQINYLLTKVDFDQIFGFGHFEIFFPIKKILPHQKKLKKFFNDGVSSIGLRYPIEADLGKKLKFHPSGLACAISGGSSYRQPTLSYGPLVETLLKIRIEAY